MQPRPDHPGEPSVATALHWLFTHVLQQSASRQWRGANVLYWPRSDDVQPRVAHARDLGTRDYSDETHIALPFDMLRDLPAQIPQHCQLGALVILSFKLFCCRPVRPSSRRCSRDRLVRGLASELTLHTFHICV